MPLFILFKWRLISYIIFAGDEAVFTQIILPADVKHVKLTILEVYKGTKYRDTCITSIEVNEKVSER